MSEVVVAFVWGDGLQDCSDTIPKGWDRALTSLAQVGFEFCEGLLDGIEIGGIGRQQPQLRAGRLDDLAYARNLVGGQIVHRHDLARRERRHQALFEIGEEDFAIHRGGDDERSRDGVLPQAGDERGHLPVAMRDLGDQPLAARAASTQPGHVG